MNIPQWTKPALWGAAVGGVAVAIVGFSWGGWVTGGAAEQAATEAAAESRADLAAAICVQRFLAQDDARARLAELQGESSSFSQRQFVEEGGWSLMPDREEVGRQSATLCARMLNAIEPEEVPVTEDGEVVEPGTVVEPTTDEPEAVEAEPEAALEPTSEPDAAAEPVEGDEPDAVQPAQTDDAEPGAAAPPAN